MLKIQHFIGIAVAVITIPNTITLAQSVGGSLEDAPWIGVITSDNVSIRCGANESYYPVAIAMVGDLVEVFGNRQQWLKIYTAGSVFSTTVGYVKYPSTETSVFTAIGDRGAVIHDVDVLAKNIDSDELYRSWRPVLRLHDGDAVQILESIITEPGDLHREAYIVHTIQMPPNATVWVNTINIKRATPEQIALFHDSLRNGTETASKPKDTVEVSQNAEGDTSIDEPKSVESLPGALTEKTSIATTQKSVAEITPQSPSTPTLKLIPLSLAELEAAWDKISEEPVMGAEVSPLRDMYVELLEANKNDLVIDRIATGRIKQLNVWSQLQQQRVRIELLRTDLGAKNKKIGEFQSVMELYEGYAIVGRLALSHTFDGRLRPFMFRIQDMKSGRTLGYVPANKDWELSGLIGQIIGITGKIEWDPNWRVNVVQVKRFDLLSPTTATVPPDIE